MFVGLLSYSFFCRVCVMAVCCVDIDLAVPPPPPPYTSSFVSSAFYSVNSSSSVKTNKIFQISRQQFHNANELNELNELNERNELSEVNRVAANWI